MAPICGVCEKEDSKYKCPKCELRYCSLVCYKTHKQTHPAEPASISASASIFKPAPRDRPGTKQRVAKPTFEDFENDPEFTRLLKRYPSLKVQLGAVYAMTLEPGPDDARNWNKSPFQLSSHHGQHSQRGGRFRGRVSNRGMSRGRAMRGAARGGFDTGVKKRWFDADEDERQRGPWTREKGDKEALRILREARNGPEDDKKAEGVREFVELCRMRFGQANDGE